MIWLEPLRTSMACNGKVVSRRRRVRGRRDQDTVFHEGDLGAAFGTGPPHTDVRTQSEAILFLDVHSWNRPQKPVDVVERNIFFQMLPAEIVGRTRHGGQFRRIADHHDALLDDQIGSELHGDPNDALLACRHCDVAVDRLETPPLDAKKVPARLNVSEAKAAPFVHTLSSLLPGTPAQQGYLGIEQPSSRRIGDAIRNR